MNTCIALLRGINVSGQNSVKMDDLTAIFRELDFTDIRTYIQSGNVIFKSTQTSCDELEKMISERILLKLGMNVKTFVFDEKSFEGIIGKNPFIADKTKEQAFLHITFLSDRPDKLLIESLQSFKLPEEEFLINNRAIYLYCPKGYGKTKLNNTLFEKKLKTVATTRNWRTVIEILKIAQNQ